MIVFLAITPGIAHADSNTVLQGHVFDNDGKPVAGARVVASGASGMYRTKTDAGGRFVMFGLENDIYTVSADATELGFAPGLVLGTVVTPGETDFVAIQLSRSNCPTYGYSVRGGSSYLLEARSHRSHFLCE